MTKIYFPLLALVLSQSTWASSGPATVILLKGNVTASGGKNLQLKDTVPPGTEIKTGAKSIVKLLFPDNSQISVGPETTMKIEATNPGEPGLVNLVGGQIRAKVTKDLLKDSSGETKDKMYLKTKTAAMGIRGTDFQLGFNLQNNMTALITFEGAVAMVKALPNENPAAALAAKSDALVTVGAGQYSGSNPDLPNASIPVKVSPAQIESMRSNENLDGAGDRPQQKADAMGSPVPPGVDPRSFASSDNSLSQSMGNLVGAETMNAAKEAVESPSAAGTTAAPPPPPEGFFDAKTGAFAPRAGGFIDLNTGIYVPPPPGAQFDPNTGVYVPPPAMGSFDPVTGVYAPPKGLELDAKKGFVAEGTAKAAAAGTAPPPPPPAAASLLTALNQTLAPTSAGKTVTFETAFLVAPGAPPPPPPPGAPPPGSQPPPGNLPPPPPEPVNDPFCPTCIDDNVLPPPPQNSPIRFNIQVI